MENKIYDLAFSHCLGIGPVKFDTLLSHFGTAQKAYEANHEEMAGIIGAKTAQAFIEFRTRFNPQNKLENITKKNIKVLPRYDKQYPQSLREIPDPPIVLYVRGDLSLIDFKKNYFISIVGTRRPSSYGIYVTKKFAEELASIGFVIVSGMALGVDAIAHQAALDMNGKTVAVLGCGVDLPHPPSNLKIYESIVAGGGLVLSEFPPGMTVLPGLFVARNRIVSGLSQGILVTEGAKDSGALITARYAGIQGKDIFATPAPITGEMSAAPNLLLKEGAKLVTSVDDILSEFNLQVTPQRAKTVTQDLTPEEKKIFDLLTKEAKTTDEIVAEAGLSINTVLQSLSMMEIKGIAFKNSDGKYQLKAL